MTAGNTVAAAIPDWTNDDLLGIRSFDDALALVRAQTEIETASDVLGDGFSLLDDKSALTGVPCIFVKWEFHKSTKGSPEGEFVSAHVVARLANGSMLKVVVNDGGTGIYEQLRTYTDKRGIQAGLVAHRGLRRSDYIHPEHGPATTWYIDTSGQ